MTKPPFHSPAVADKFATYSPAQRDGLMLLRGMIFDVAAQLPQVGEIEETLKWGQPSYRTPKTKSGSTIRLGVPKSGEKDGQTFGIYAHCQTSLISDFQIIFSDDFAFEGNRGIHFASADDLPLDKMQMFISSALTYHIKK